MALEDYILFHPNKQIYYIFGKIADPKMMLYYTINAAGSEMTEHQFYPIKDARKMYIKCCKKGCVEYNGYLPDVNSTLRGKTDAYDGRRQTTTKNFLINSNNLDQNELNKLIDAQTTEHLGNASRSIQNQTHQQCL